MTDTLQTIQSQQSNDRAEALSLREQAAQLRQKAIGIKANQGDGHVYEEQARELDQRAEVLEAQASKADDMFRIMQLEIEHLQDERENIEREMQQKIKEIDRKILALRGGSVALM